MELWNIWCDNAKCAKVPPYTTPGGGPHGLCAGLWGASLARFFPLGRFFGASWPHFAFLLRLLSFSVGFWACGGNPGRILDQFFVVFLFFLWAKSMLPRHMQFSIDVFCFVSIFLSSISLKISVSPRREQYF